MDNTNDIKFSYILPLLMLVVMCCVFSVDIYIPSLPQMVNFFATTQEKIQFTITAGMLGSTILTIFIGPLSDAFGRRKLIVFCQFGFSLMTYLATLATSVEMLIVARVFQGMLNVGGMVLSFAIISDVSHGKMIAIRFSYITTTITTSLVLAPFIGGLLAVYDDWRYCFWLLSFLSFISASLLFFLLPETNKIKKPFSILKTTKNYQKIFTNKIFLILIFIPSMMIGTHIAFTASSSFYYKEVLGISPFAFGIYQSIIMSANSAFNYLSSFSIHRWGEKKTINIGMITSCIGAIMFLIVTFILPYSAIAITFSMIFCSGGLGFMMSSLSAECFSIFKESSGATSSAMSFIRAISFALMVSVISVLYNGKLIVLSGSIAIVTFLSLFMYFFALKSRQRQI